MPKSFVDIGPKRARERIVNVNPAYPRQAVSFWLTGLRRRLLGALQRRVPGQQSWSTTFNTISFLRNV